jgi:triosephosphate isomerase
MKKYVIGNWKCHKTIDDGLDWFQKFSRYYRKSDKVKVVVAPTFLCLDRLSVALDGLQLSDVSLAAQDVSAFPRGNYTGAIAADMLKPLVDYVIVGHAERRRYYHETVQDVINKVAEAADCGLAPIVCVEDAELLSQLRPLADIECKELIVAYTPVEVLTFNIPESVDRIAEAVKRIKAFFPTLPIIYGGRISEENAKDYLAIQGLNGLFVGEASLEAEKFARICEFAEQSVEHKP